MNEPLRIARLSPNAENDVDSAVLKCYDLGARSDIKAYAMASLLNHVAKEPFFTQLRTREQLGYLVSLSYSSSRGRLLLVLRIQSQRVCADEVAKRIEAFLAAWRPESIEDADFAAAKGALAKKWREPDRSMASEAAGAWGALLAPDADGAPSFDRADRVAAAVEALALGDVQRFYDEHVLRAPRLVDVCVFGRDDEHAGDDDLPAVPAYFDAPARAVAE